MKTALKIIIGLILLVLLILGSGALYINASGIPNYEVEKVEYSVSPSPEKIARGEKLASMLCNNCHANAETGILTGREMKDVTHFGKIYSQNITQDKEHGIGNWTDGEIYYLLRAGILPSGRYSPPYMAKLPHMADSDIEAIIAYLRSDAKEVQAAAVPDEECEPSFLTKFLCKVAFKPLPLPEGPIEMPNTSKTVVLGKYLATNLDCRTCHSANFETINIMEPEKSEGFYGGGNALKDLQGNELLSSNITMHETGIGSWTKEEFVKTLKTGLREGKDAVQYPMVPYPQLSDREAEAIWEYLQIVPKIENDIETKS